MNKNFNQIRVGDTFFLTEENSPLRFMKVDGTNAMSENGNRIKLGGHVEVSPEIEHPYTEEQLNLLNLIHGHMGGDVYYRNNPLVDWFFYTEGIRDLAKTAECYWLIDTIFLWQTRSKLLHEPFQSWTLEKTLPLISPQDMLLHVQKGWMPSATWVLRCTDGGADGETERELCRQYIPYSTFPLDSVNVWVEDGTSPDGKLCRVLLLPSEH